MFEVINMKGKSKRGQVWCSKCDAQIVSLGTKCPNCGVREHVSKKKQKQAIIDIMKADEKDGLYYEE
jgi:tRNA(Ile2) C34 agmatinyltransferase TiaS